MRLRRAPLLAGLLLVLLAAPAFAASTWYDYYLDARDKHLPNKRYKEALANLQEAVRLKPEPALNEQTYGLDFINYLPYYYEGLAYLGLGDNNSAIRLFNIEEQKGAVRRVKKIGNAQLFEPALGQREYRGGVVRELLALFGGSPRLLVSSLLETGTITLRDLKALQDAAPAATAGAGRRKRSRRGKE